MTSMGYRNQSVKRGFYGFVRRLGQRGCGSSKGNQKNVVVRAAAKVLSKPLSEKSQYICDEGRLKEAQETLQLGKRLVIETKGQDDAIIQQLILLEEGNKESVGKGYGRFVSSGILLGSDGSFN
ncbi:hypothetical protein LOK49_LG05G03479 [Camellia lanceoleosa]|uniref:Uncharacterized protein n=1 Tax=Camellia lanceoleosa TaxID=1840588 RepID=A0ACC0HMC5_9ERIC|nr:hypothetical protein LOK49_LG05G03479 [Camellia lanceoleosa]